MKKRERNSLTIANIVSAGSVADSIDMDAIADKVPGCEYSSKKFAGAVYHIQNPKSVALIFSSGKIVLTGINRSDDIAPALQKIVKTLRDAGVPCFDNPRVTITNIVCTYNLKQPCNLERILTSLLDFERVEYEPECFPGLVYRISDPKVVFLIFSSGRIVITGGLNMADIRKGIVVLKEKLSSVVNFDLDM